MNKNKLSLYFASLLAICFITHLSCSPKPTKAPPPPPRPDVANIAPALEKDILQAINRYRLSKKLPALQSNFIVESEARRHSIDMASHRVAFGHDGFNARMRIITSKIPGIVDVAENVAYGNLSSQEVVDTWLKSTGHRQNIEGNFRLTGIGVARDNKSRLYFTQLFAR